MVRIQPATPTAPTKVRIRQVVWMTLLAHEVDAAASQLRHAAGALCNRPLATLSLEDLDLQTLAVLLHPSSYKDVYSSKDPNRIFAKLVALPYHDAWGSLDEFYKSMARIEKFMSNEYILTSPGVVIDRWPLVFPLMTATGNVESRYALSSPLPPEAFGPAATDRNFFGSDKLLRIQAPDPSLPGEYTLVFLREPNLGRLRYGLVTRDDAGQLEVHDPAAVACAVNDEEAVTAWECGIGALTTWKSGEKAEIKDRNTMLLDTAAGETMWAASAALATQEDEINKKIYKLKRARKQKG
ncbi:hypothetical protein F4803DRAFT_517156 [Xylaria telfairii]|nr:hypothetical protein F4803DRAFT_517156 [Xylaria telfairii]